MHVVPRFAFQGCHNKKKDEELVLVDQIQPVQLGASLPLPRSTPAGIASLSFCTLVRKSAPMWWLLVGFAHRNVRTLLGWTEILHLTSFGSHAP